MIKVFVLQGNKMVEAEPSRIGDTHASVWTDVSSPSDQDWDMISQYTGIPSMDLREFYRPSQRPIIQDIGAFTVIVFHSVAIEKARLKVKSHLILVSKEQKDFITIHPETSRSVEKIQSLPEARLVELFRKGSTAILYALLDEMVNRSNEVIDHISDQVDRAEQKIFEPTQSSQILKDVFNIKKQLIYFQRSLSANREVTSGIEKAYGQFLDKRLISQFRFLYSDLTQQIEAVTTYRDVLVSTLEIHLSAISNNLNVVMKRLTSWAGIILVPSLIAGIYGMNLAILPFAKEPEGFYYVIGVMAGSVILLYLYFRHKDWI